MSNLVKLQVFLVGDPALGGRMDSEGFSRNTTFNEVEQQNAIRVIGVESLILVWFWRSMLLVIELHRFLLSEKICFVGRANHTKDIVSSI